MALFASLYKQLIYQKRYLINTLFSMLLFVVLFIAVAFGYSVVSSSPFEFGHTLSGLIVSYYAWTLMMSVYTSTGYTIEQNKSNGTLENLIVNSQNPTLILITECLANTLVYFVFSWCIIGILCWVFSIALYIHVITVLVILMVGLVSVLGLSLVVAGVEMIIRKTDSILSILQFVLLGSLFMSDNTITRLFIPFFSANLLLKSSFIENMDLLCMPIELLLSVVINSTIYLLIGVGVFTYGLHHAKKRGTLSFY